MSYKKSAIIGISWTFLLRAVNRGIAFLRFIILARFFLSPYEYGLFGIATITYGILDIFTDTGIDVFLIQKGDTMNSYISSAWVIGIIRGAILSLILFLINPLIVTYFHTPQASQILFLIALVPFINGCINPSEIKFQQQLTFHKEFYFRTSLLLIETLTIFLVVISTHSAISLAIGIIISSISEVILSFILCTPRPSFVFNKTQWNEIIHKGKWVTTYGILQYISQEGDTIIVGKLLGPMLLAFYQTAYKLGTIPISEINDVISKVIFPVYSKISGTKERLQKAFTQTSVVLTILSLLAGGIIFFFPQQIVLLSVGKAWTPVIPILRILIIFGVIRAIFGSISSLLLSVERQDLVARMIFIRLSAMMLTIIPLTSHYGLTGTAYSVLFSSIVEVPYVCYCVYFVFKKHAE